MTDDLRWDIISELARLPVKCFTRLKSFYPLISQDSDFKNENRSRTNLTRVILYLGYETKHICLSSILYCLPFNFPNRVVYQPPLEDRNIDLPWDITTEILSRLPAKSLMRFKCVSKSFYSLISHDSCFKKNHLDRSNLRMATLCLDHETKSVYSCSISSLSPNEAVHQDVVKLDIPDKLEGLHRIYNSCNGLFCVGDMGGGVFLWNPFTRELKKLPDCPIDIDESLIFKGVSYALAYDSFSDDYKVLRIVRFCDLQGDYGSESKFYSVKTDSSWRKIQDFPYRYFKWDDHNLVNGRFHWLANVTQNRGPHVVVSLDVTTGKYRVFALPQQLNDSVRPTVCVLNGKLALVRRCFGNYTVWVMEEYGIMESLTKMVTIPLNQLRCYRCKPLYLFKDGKIMIHTQIGTQEQAVIYKDGKFVCKAAVANCETVSWILFPYRQSYFTTRCSGEMIKILNGGSSSSYSKADKHSAILQPERNLCLPKRARAMCL